MSSEKGSIYKIINLINEEIYIGCTINTLTQRFNEHLYRCFKTDYKSKLYNSMKKYGQNNFRIELIEECDLKILYETEKKYIELYDTYHSGLNSTLGGEGCLGYVHSEEIRKKISERTKNGNSHKGKSYEDLYSNSSLDEKEKRRISVKKYWDNLTEEERKDRTLKNTIIKQKKSKYGIDFVKEIKNKINNGLKIKEFRELYPQVRESFFYELKNNKRWKNI